MISYTYLWIDIGCIIIPLIASFYPKRPFFTEWKSFFMANFLVALFYLLWDYLFTKWGIWGFNPEYLTGIYFGNLPLEEVLFFICIPYACVFTYYILKYLVRQNPFEGIHRSITLGLGLLLIVIGCFSFGKWYTVSTCFLTAGALLYLYLVKRNLSYHFLTYGLVLPFFFLSNGLLTGSFLDAPIVWYDNGQNLGLRLGTIPIEDICYGFLLILMNIELFNYFRHRKRSTS